MDCAHRGNGKQKPDGRARGVLGAKRLKREIIKPLTTWGYKSATSKVAKL